MSSKFQGARSKYESRATRNSSLGTWNSLVSALGTRHSALFASLLLVALILTACSSGSARESERAQNAALEETAVVPERQATFTAQFVEQATPTKIPDRAPGVAALVLTTSVGGDGSPNGEYDSIPSNAGTIYIAANLTGVQEGQVVRAAIRDTTPQRNILVSGDVTISSDANSIWVAVPLQMNGSLPPGDYPVWIVVNPDAENGGEWLQSLVFTVTSPGNSPQQVSSGAPSQGSSGGGSDSDPLHPEGSNSNSGSDDDDGGDSPQIQPRDGEPEDG